MKIRHPLLTSFFSLGVLRLFAIPLGLFLSVVLARGLGPEEFGRFSFALSALTLLALPLSGGLPALLTREIASSIHDEDWAYYRGIKFAAFGWVIFFSCVVLVGYWLVNELFPQDIVGSGKWELLSTGIMFVPLLGLIAVVQGVVKGSRKPALAELPMQVIHPVFLLIICLVLWKLEWLSAQAALLSTVLAGGIALVISLWILRNVESSGAKKYAPRYTVKRWAGSLLPFAMLAFVATCNTQVSIMVLGAFNKDSDVAAMRVAEQGGQLVTLALILINVVIAPEIVTAFKKRERARLQKIAHYSALGGFCLALPVALILIIFGESLISVVFGQEYSNIAYTPLLVLVVGHLVNVFFGPVGKLLTMSGYEKESLRAQIVGLILNLTLSLLLVPSYGAAGAAVGVSVSMLAFNVILYFRVKQRLGVRCRAL